MDAQLVSVVEPNNGCFNGQVSLGRNLAVHFGFPTDTDARKWVTLMEKKIKKQDCQFRQDTAY